MAYILEGLSYNLTISSPKFGTAVYFILILPTLPSYSNALLLCCDDTKDLSIEFVTCSEQIEQTIIFFLFGILFFNLFSIDPTDIFYQLVQSKCRAIYYCSKSNIHILSAANTL